MSLGIRIFLKVLGCLLCSLMDISWAILIYTSYGVLCQTEVDSYQKGFAIFIVLLLRGWLNIKKNADKWDSNDEFHQILPAPLIIDITFILSLWCTALLGSYVIKNGWL